MQLKFVEPTMGMFHLKMMILQQLYKSHFGKEKHSWSLHMWIKELGQDYRKMWDDSQKGEVKNFHASRHVFFMVPKDYVFASIALEIYMNGRRVEFIEPPNTLHPWFQH